MKSKIIPINDPGKLIFAKDNKYEISTPKSEKAMISTSCLNIFMYIYYTIPYISLKEVTNEG